MKICIIGTGYVGLVSGVCFAELGQEVCCVDIDVAKIAQLNQGESPIYEPGLTDLLQRNLHKRLSFSTDLAASIKAAEIVFSAVGTPPDADHRADLSAVRAVAKIFGETITKPTIYVNKSTVPVGTNAMVRKIIQAELDRRQLNLEFEVASNPEFLREGNAIKDTLEPDRIVVGVDSPRAAQVMQALYEPLTRVGRTLILTDIKSAEVIKYAANSFLATKISFINEMANFCDRAGADIAEVARGIGLDHRIGSHFLRPGIGYGGSCFPKDVQALLATGREHDYEFKILRAVEEVNNYQRELFWEKLQSHFPSMVGQKIAVWGLAFKPETDDVRAAPALTIIDKLLAAGAQVTVYDPVAMPKVRPQYPQLIYASDAFSALKEVNALLVMTEWDEFRAADLQKIKEAMKGRLVLDARNIFNPQSVRAVGLEYECFGRPDRKHS